MPHGWLSILLLIEAYTLRFIVTLCASHILLLTLSRGLLIFSAFFHTYFRGSSDPALIPDFHFLVEISFGMPFIDH